METLELTDIVALSIHAPTRGATFLLYTLYVQCQLSIHAPTTGAT